MIECVCLYPECDEQSGYSEKIVLARKKHICIECGETIKIGDKFKYAICYFFDKSIDHDTICLRCNSITRDFFPCGYVIGSLYETFEAHFGFKIDEVPN